MHNPKLIWTVTGLLSLLLGVSALQKLSFAPATVDDFSRWGYAMALMVGVGVVEVMAVVLLLVPRLRAFGASLVLALMLGAAYTHLAHGEFARLGLVAAVFATAFYLGWVSRNNLMLPRAV